MSSRTLARARFGAAVAIAFASGIVFASGFDLTRFGYAQSRGTAAKPTVQEVKPIADASNAFVSIAEHVTPFPDAYRTIKEANLGLVTLSEADAEIVESGPNQCAIA